MNDPQPDAIPANQLLDCFWRLDLDLRIAYASPAAESMFGIPPAALVGSPLADHMEPDDFARIGDLLQHALASADRTQGLLYRTRIKHADGRSIPVEVHSRLVLDARGEPDSVVGLARDITERERRQATARQRERERLADQKLDAVTRLAAGIAPDLAALLAALEQCPETGARPEIQTLLGRAAERVRQLQVLAGLQELLPQDVDVDRFVRETIESLRVTLPAGVALTFEPGAADATARLDPVQIADVLRQLCTNASQALPAGGLIRVSTGVRAAAPAAGAPPSAPPQPQITVAVTDNGDGLDRDAREQILDPFVSTRPETAAGLGLSLARGVVRQHGGRLEVDSRLGRGTTVRIVLPASYAATTERPPREGSGRRVLLVDDDPDILRYVERVLRSDGYEVVTCTDGVEALALLSDEPGFDAVVLDWALPGIDGRRVREQAVTRLHLPLLVISGHRREHYEALGSVDADTPWLLKPFTPTMLLEAVRSLLRREDEARGS